MFELEQRLFLPAAVTESLPQGGREAIASARRSMWRQLATPHWAQTRASLTLPPLLTRAGKVEGHGPVVRFFRDPPLDGDEDAALQRTLIAMRPWKKGPFDFFGHRIDAEWRCDWKWARLSPHLPSLTGTRICDVGCHNGYYLYRMLAHKPAWVLGIDPVPKHLLTLNLLQQLAPTPGLFYEPLGVADLGALAGVFDVIFCLGILYHHTDPVGICRQLWRALRPGGHLIVDCQGIGGESPLAWVPPGRYAGSGGTWFLPTASALQHWLRRAQFRTTQLVYSAPLSPAEQRRTAWAPIASLADFLAADDPERTVEGHPRPWRHYVVARR